MPADKQKQKKNSGVFQVTVSDPETLEEKWSAQFTRPRVLVVLVTAAVVLLFSVFALIAFTPIRTFIPGYPDAQTKHDAIVNAIRIDSLESVIGKWELYSENLRRVVEGKTPLDIDSILSVRQDTASVATHDMAGRDSLLRAAVEQESRLELRTGAERALPIEGMHFFSPLKGVVTQGYDQALHPYVDITAPENSVVTSVLDGTVIAAFWSDEDGYTIQIQHAGDIVSVYKHNQKLMKKTGDKVKAGTPVAIVGSSGSLSEGHHLHFELWHGGNAVDPAKYISF